MNPYGNKFHNENKNIYEKPIVNGTVVHTAHLTWQALLVGSAEKALVKKAAAFFIHVSAGFPGLGGITPNPPYSLADGSIRGCWGSQDEKKFE